MPNLEQLALHVNISDIITLIDGNNLKNDIVHHLTRLKIIRFNIRSICLYCMHINLPTNEEIQERFRIVML